MAIFSKTPAPAKTPKPNLATSIAASAAVMVLAHYAIQGVDKWAASVRNLISGAGKKDSQPVQKDEGDGFTVDPRVVESILRKEGLDNNDGRAEAQG